MVEQSDAAQLQDVEAISEARRPLLAYGAVVLEEIIRVGRPREIAISATGVREGLLYEQLDRDARAADALIASAASLKSLRETRGTLFAKAVWEGYRHGRAARWISGEDYLTLLHEPIEAARRRLGIREPVLYRRAQAELGEELASYMKAERQQALAA